MHFSQTSSAATTEFNEEALRRDVQRLHDDPDVDLLFQHNYQNQAHSVAELRGLLQTMQDIETQYATQAPQLIRVKRRRQLSRSFYAPEDEFEDLRTISRLMASYGMGPGLPDDDASGSGSGTAQDRESLLQADVDRLVSLYLTPGNTAGVVPRHLYPELRGAEQVWNADNYDFLKHAPTVEETGGETVFSKGFIRNATITMVSASSAIVVGFFVLPSFGMVGLPQLFTMFRVYSVVSTAGQEDNLRDMLKELARGSLNEVFVHVSGIIVQNSVGMVEPASNCLELYRRLCTTRLNSPGWGLHGIWWGIL